MLAASWRWLGRGGRRLGLLILLLLLVAQRPVFDDVSLWPVRQWMFDQYQRWKPRTPESRLRVRIVDIDERSLEAIGQWPWSRARLAQLIDTVVRKGALSVALDILLVEPDRQSPDLFADSYPGLDPALRQRLKALKPSDEVFGEVAAGYSVVLARAGMGDARIGADRQLQFPSLRIEGEDPRWALPGLWPGVLANVAAIEQRAPYHGVVNRYPSSDGAVRKVPVVARVAGGISASLALEAIRATVWEETLTLVGDRNGMLGVQVADTFYDTNPDGSVYPYFARDDPMARRISAERLLRDPDSVSNHEFKGQVVLLGVTGLGTVDAPPTAIAPRMDGVELQAQLIEVLLTGTRLLRPKVIEYAEAGVLAMTGLAVVVGLPVLRPVAGVGLAAMLAAMTVAAGFGQFASQRLLFDPSYPVAGMIVVYVAMLSSMLAEGVRQRRALNAALERERLAHARLAGELDAAREIQMGILPDTRNIEALPSNLQVFAMLEPAREVGGNLYDVFMLDERRLFFVVGDVSGKGVPASLFMAISKALCRSVALRVSGSAAAKISVTNDEISRENPALLFVTAVAGVIDAHTGTLDFCIAGHDAPMLLRRGEEPFELQSEGGPPLCVLDDFEYPAERYQLQPGDTVVLSTDGISEAMNPAGELYGRARIMQVLGGIEDDTAPEPLIDVLYQDVARHRAEASPSDDLTVMAIRFGSPAP